MSHKKYIVYRPFNASLQHEEWWDDDDRHDRFIDLDTLLDGRCLLDLLPVEWSVIVPHSE
jgi:hypothetical protein